MYILMLTFIFRGFVNHVSQKIKVSLDICRVTFDCMVGKTTERNHLSVRIKIFVHNEPPKINDVCNKKVKTNT